MSSRLSNLSGNWLGKLRVFGGVELTIVFKFTPSLTGKKFDAVFDSPDQGVVGQRCDEVTLEEDALKIDMPIIHASFRGQMDWDEKRIRGIWEQGESSFDLDLCHTEDYFGLSRPQEPKPPFPYLCEEVTFENEEDGVCLSGTLTLPESGVDVPAVILITGSGPHDRDECICGHKPFLVIADFLTRNGIAVLRYDDRGVGASSGTFSKATSFHFAKDALAAVDYLKSRSEIDAHKIGLVGHSEGGLIAQVVASENPVDVSFVIMLAGHGIQGDELILLQSQIIAMNEGVSEEEIHKALDKQEKLLELLKSDQSNEAIGEEVRKMIYDLLCDVSEFEENSKEGQESMIQAQMKTLLSDWYRTFLRCKPSDYIEKNHMPVLALFGEKDTQVPPNQNLPEIERLLIQTGNEKSKALEIQGLNHLFQTAETGNIWEYGKIEETFSPHALQVILDWILELFP